MFKPKRKDFYWGAIVLDFFNFLRKGDMVLIDYHILFNLIEKIEPINNIAYVKQVDIARELFLDPGNVSRSINKLLSQQFVVRVSNGFMINPSLFYIGKSAPNDRKQLRYEFNEEVLKYQDYIRFELDETEKKLKEIFYEGNPYKDFL